MSMPALASALSEDASRHTAEGEPGKNDKFLDEMSRSVEPLGLAIVSVAGSLEGVRDRANETSENVHTLLKRAEAVGSANASVRKAVSEASDYVQNAAERATESRGHVSEAAGKIRDLAEWVQSSGGKFQELHKALGHLEGNANEISRIADQVNILAINASIEAARAGEAGRGFAVVAAAVTELARSTSATTQTISSSLQALKKTTQGVIHEGESAFEKATDVIADTDAVGGVFSEMEQTFGAIRHHAAEIETHVDSIDSSFSGFEDGMRRIDEAAATSAQTMTTAAKDMNGLVDLSEEIVCLHSAMGGAVKEQASIAHVMGAAQEIGARFEAAIAAGDVRAADMFDHDYKPIPGTDPQQHMTRFTETTDRLLPAIQEAALDLHDRVVFCAAVDVNGYLPTHNRKFSQP